MDTLLWLLRYWLAFIILVVSIFGTLYLVAGIIDLFFWLTGQGKNKLKR